MRAAMGILGVVALSACQTTATPTTSSSAAARPDATRFAVSAFVEACVKTSNNPDAAGTVLETLGFRASGSSKTGATYRSSFATATVSRDTRTNRAGQCTVTPNAANFSTVVAVLNTEIARSGVPAQKLGGEEAWLVGGTGAVALVSRSKGAMTRTQPGVFRG